MSIRLFASIHVPEEVGAGLVSRQAGIDGARWRPLEAFHITLRFFGNVAENVADDIDSALCVVSGPALDIEMAGAGFFKDGLGEIDAVWAGVADNPALSQLQRRCETAARKAGLAPVARAYRPHVTLAYLRRADPAAVAAWVQANNLLKSPPFRTLSFGLYSSHQTSEGSTYRLEREYPLG